MDNMAGEISTKEPTEGDAASEYPLCGWDRHADVEHLIDFCELEWVEVAQAVPEEERAQTVGEHCA